METSRIPHFHRFFVPLSWSHTFFLCHFSTYTICAHVNSYLLAFQTLLLTQLGCLLLNQTWRWGLAVSSAVLLLHLQKGFSSFSWGLLAPLALSLMMIIPDGVGEENSLVTGPPFQKFCRPRKKCFGLACYLHDLLNDSRKHWPSLFGLHSTTLKGLYLLRVT